MSNRFQSSKICKDENDLLVRFRTVRNVVLEAVQSLVEDVDYQAAYDLCTILVNAVTDKRNTIEQFSKRDHYDEMDPPYWMVREAAERRKREEPK